jgi:hypothetical protein
MTMLWIMEKPLSGHQSDVKNKNKEEKKYAKDDSRDQ